MGIFGELFKKNNENEVSDVIEVSEEKVNEITPEQNKDNDVEKALKYEEMLKDDKLDIEGLTSELMIIGGVLNYICSSFSSVINIKEKEDYPLITMKKISKEDKWLSGWEKNRLNEGLTFILNIKGLVNTSLYTHEGAILYIKKYYEIRERHLKELFPND